MATIVALVLDAAQALLAKRGGGARSDRAGDQGVGMYPPVACNLDLERAGIAGS